MFIYIFIGIVIVQRLVELYIAKKNEQWMISQGAIEFGQRHYKVMVLIHTLFFISLLGEMIWNEGNLSSFWPFYLILFILTQVGRVWIITSLGKYWNTKIFVLPEMNVIVKGPYKYFKHPNYVLVTIELIVIPLLFDAFWTLFFFGCLNQLILAIRIPIEEKALKQITNYEEIFPTKKRWARS
ncbi:isoprenylcysteine carboxylmethyltransferase family protein [Bacillus spongiae]|uniref:Isoprenylcysteine carboxylmethyltransferase family protein n=1 Tax=Bacillus spongiae TaxID=2683610 RepID=A0ABU8HDJ0_9BACI